MSDSRLTLRTKNGNYKAEKEEMNKFQRNINEVLKEEGIFHKRNKAEDIWRVKKNMVNIHSFMEEGKYNINEIVKRYELVLGSLSKGFSEKYFRKLTDLLHKKYYKNYPKERLKLFNLRVKGLKHKSLSSDNFFENGLTPKPKLKDNFFVTSNNEKTRNNHNKNLLLSPQHNTKDGSLSSDFDIVLSPIYKKINHNFFPLPGLKPQSCEEKKAYNFKLKIRDFSGKKKINKKIKYSLNNNQIRKHETFEYKYNSDKNNIWINDIDPREEFLINEDRGLYCSYLKEKYNFFEKKNTLRFKYLKNNLKRMNLYKLLPNHKFLDIPKRDIYKIGYFNRIKRSKIKNIFLKKNFLSCDERNSERKKLSCENIANDLINKNYQKILNKLNNNLSYIKK